jgi:Na+/H+ antiporter NhaB
MALMLAKTYAAFKAAGVPDTEAQAAAEEIAEEISDLRLLKWMVGGIYVLLTVIGVPSIWLLLRVAAKVGALGT